MKLVIAFSEPIEAEAIAQVFMAHGCTIAAIGTTGTEALSLCCDLQPDCLITEPFLPYLNCDEIAGILEQKCTHPLIKLVLSPEKNDTMAQRFMAAGGDLYLRAPFDPAFTVRRMEFFLNQRQGNPAPEAESQAVIYITASLLEQMKMPAGLQGFQYIQDAIERINEDPDLKQKLVSELYPAIARLRQTTAGGVERCIRNAITQTFERGNTALLLKQFSHVIKPATGRPTNGEFLATLFELVKGTLK